MIKFKNTAFIVSFFYLCFGFLWIILSDNFVTQYFPYLENIKYFQTIKGLVFVSVSAMLIYQSLHLILKKVKLQESQITVAEENYRKLFMNNPFPMWVYDLKTLGFLEINNAAVDAYGYSREEFLKMNLFDIRPPEDHEDLMQNVASDDNKRFTTSGIWRHIKKNGQLVYVEINSHPLDFNNRKAKIVLALDISARKEAEKEIQVLIYELDNFVYRASHDLRGPLARLKGLSQVALMETNDTVSRNYFNMISTSANVLDNTLLRLLSINNLKNSILEEEELNVYELIEEVIVLKKDVIASSGIYCMNQVDQKLSVLADKNTLKLAIQNILENSIEYRNPEAATEMYIKITSSLDDNNVKLTFEDNGIGIDESQIDRIFNIFHRGTEKSQGSGLGLYIAKIAMNKMHGSINLKSYQKSHTVFELLIPTRSELQLQKTV